MRPALPLVLLFLVSGASASGAPALAFQGQGPPPPPAGPGAKAEAPAPEVVPADLDAVVRAASALLVELQENLDDPEAEPQEWPYEGVYREGGDIPPGYRVGGTAIACWALIETPGFEGDAARQAAVQRGLDFVLAQLSENTRMAHGFNGRYDVRGWGHIYALNLLLRMRAKGLFSRDQLDPIDEMTVSLIATLQGTELPAGGWNYARSKGLDTEKGASAFMTVPAILALRDALEQGFQVDPLVIERAVTELESVIDGTVIPYNTARGGRDTHAGSIGRLPGSELALLAAGKGSVERVEASVASFLEHWEELEKRRQKTGTHKPPHGIAPYYFFYAHLYTALAIEAIPAERRAGYRQRFLARLFQVREQESGGWNDRVFPRSENFGTAMSILALLAPELPPPTGLARGGLEVTYVGNEGFLLEGPEGKVLIDSLYRGGIAPYVIHPKERIDAMEAAEGPFEGVDVVLATHAHGDHFEAASVAAHLKANPSARCVTTEQAALSVLEFLGDGHAIAERVTGVTPPEGERARVDANGVEVTVLQLHHGRARNVENVGFLFELGGKRILHVGDTMCSAKEIAGFGLGDDAIDLAFLPSWYLSVESLAEAAEAFGAAEMVLMHVPPKSHVTAEAEAMGGWDELFRKLEARWPTLHIFEDTMQSRRFP